MMMTKEVVLGFDLVVQVPFHATKEYILNRAARHSYRAA